MKSEDIVISTDAQKLDLDFIHDFISNTHWAKGRTLGEVQDCVSNSLNFGVYLQGKQIGYARVVTDYVVLAYIMDVFIDQSHRKRGYSKVLMQQIMSNDLLGAIQVWRLVTQDAHFLYEKFGFKTMAQPGQMMEKITMQI